MHGDVTHQDPAPMDHMALAAPQQRQTAQVTQSLTNELMLRHSTHWPSSQQVATCQERVVIIHNPAGKSVRGTEIFLQKALYFIVKK